MGKTTVYTSTVQWQGTYSENMRQNLVNPTARWRESLKGRFQLTLVGQLDLSHRHTQTQAHTHTYRQAQAHIHTHTDRHRHTYTHTDTCRHARTLSFFQRKTAIDWKPRIAPKFQPPARILMKRTCNILNVAVGSLLQIPLLSINAVAMWGGGGMEEEKKRRDESFLFTDLSTCLCSQEILLEGVGCCWNSQGRKGLGLQFWLKGNLKTFLFRTTTTKNAEFVLVSLFLLDAVLYLAA